jgi:transcriptional regulator
MGLLSSVDNLGKQLYRRIFMPKQKSDLLQGTLDLLILKTLALEPMHGWGISQRLQQTSEGVLNVNQGSLYPALYRLEEQGWITSEWGSSDNNRQAKYYQLTKAGRKQLVEETANWQRLAAAIEQVLQTS